MVVKKQNLVILSCVSVAQNSNQVLAWVLAKILLSMHYSPVLLNSLRSVKKLLLAQNTARQL